MRFLKTRLPDDLGEDGVVSVAVSVFVCNNNDAVYEIVHAHCNWAVAAADNQFECDDDEEEAK